MTRTITVPALERTFGGKGATGTITLPAPPWGRLDIDDRAETAPRNIAVRGRRTWREDPVLRHADARRDRG